jgi:hypothetical protein
VERINAKAGIVVWRRCSRVAFIGRGTTGGGRSRSNQRRERVRGGGGGDARSDFRRKKAAGRCPMKVTTPGSLTRWAHLSARGRRRPNRTSGAGDGQIGQEEQAGLTDRVGPPVSEGEAMGRLGQIGSEEMGHSWAGKEERRSGQNYFLG